jgi:hypothetical protein
MRNSVMRFSKERNDELLKKTLHMKLRARNVLENSCR